MGDKTKKRKQYLIMAVIVLVIIAAFAVLWWNSYSMVLRRNGFDPDERSLIWAGIDDNGREYRVLTSGFGGEDTKLILVTNKAACLWEVSLLADKPSEDTMVSLSWLRTAGFKRFAVGDDTDFEFETHVVYCGNNAKKEISALSDPLPPNVTVNVQQAGSAYMLHFISFEGEAANRIDVSELLKELDYVE